MIDSMFGIEYDSRKFDIAAQVMRDRLDRLGRTQNESPETFTDQRANFHADYDSEKFGDVHTLPENHEAKYIQVMTPQGEVIIPVDAGLHAETMTVWEQEQYANAYLYTRREQCALAYLYGRAQEQANAMTVVTSAQAGENPR